MVFFWEYTDYHTLMRGSYEKQMRRYEADEQTTETNRHSVQVYKGMSSVTYAVLE